MDTTLVVMAAGMGSRFGGLKQIEPMGKNGEIILDFSVFEFIGGIFTGSVAIASDALHDLGDAIGIGAALFVLLWAAMNIFFLKILIIRTFLH